MKKRVLVIDDDYPIRLLIQKVLESEYKVCAFNNAASAIEHMEKHGNPDIIITDIKLPVIDGRLLLKNLKNSPIFGDIPVVIISSWNDYKTQMECEEAGASAYIAKPFNPDALLATLNEVIGKEALSI